MVFEENGKHLVFDTLTQRNFFTALDAVREIKSFAPVEIEKPLQDLYNSIDELEQRKRLQAYVSKAQGFS